MPLVRSLAQPRLYRTLLVATLATSLAATAYAIGRLDPAPIAITTPPITVPAANVTVIPAPVTVMPAPVAAPEPAPEPAAVPQPQPRALAPKLDAGCVIDAEGEEPRPTCAWDDGFPAIARDGSLIATKHAPSAGPSDLYSLTIRFLDPMTSRTAREVVILSQDDAAAFVYPDEDAAEAETVQRAIRTKIARRVAAVQKTLDAAKYRTLQPLGGWHENQDEAEAKPARSVDPDGPIYGEVIGAAIRIVDPKTSTVLWRGDVSVAGPKLADPTDSCGGWGLLAVGAWWDPETEYVLASSTYRTGGCMCPDLDHWTVKRAR